MSPRLRTSGVMICLSVAVGHADVNVTIYNDNLALVRDTRVFELGSGVTETTVSDVAALIDPTSVLLAGDDVHVLEQNFEYDLAGAERILDRYLDETITIVLEDGDAHTGRLVSHAGNLVLMTPERTMVVSRDKVVRIDFPELPGGLTTRPSLVWRLASRRAGAREVTFSYLTRGIGWHAEYVALVDERDAALDLSAWVSLENNSGAAYPGARVQLVAGTVHRVSAPVRAPRGAEMDVMSMAKAPAEEALFEYHLYTLPDPITVKDRQTKQVTLFPTTHVTNVDKHFRYRGGNAVSVELEFENAESEGLGIPMPKGVIRVYKNDSSGGAQFVGEDTVDHTPKGESVEITLGNAFDIAVERTVTAQQQVSKRVREQSVEVSLRNHKDESVTVEVYEGVYGDWDIVAASHEWRKESAFEVVFDVPVAADEEALLTYTIRMTM